MAGVYDSLYQSIGSIDTTTEFVGWNELQDQGAIASDAMREWERTTVRRLRRLHPKNVLEIGVGTGMLLRGLIDIVDTYCATDISEEVLTRLAHRHSDMVAAGQLRFEEGDALETLARCDPGYDLVVLNSVVQYFPSGDYLSAVLVAAARVLSPSGRVFIGDVVIGDSIAGAHLVPDELQIEPSFFTALIEGAQPLFRGALHEAKEIRALNTLSRYRYDVTLFAGPASPPTDNEVVRTFRQIPDTPTSNPFAEEYQRAERDGRSSASFW